MKKGSNKAIEAKEVAIDATTTEATTATVSVSEAKPLGRPVNPTSARQVKLAAQASKNIDGAPIRLGRPTVEGSKRQLMLAGLAEKKASGIVGQKGRPKMTEEEKAEAKAKRDAAYAVWEAAQKQKEAMRAEVNAE